MGNPYKHLFMNLHVAAVVYIFNSAYSSNDGTKLKMARLYSLNYPILNIFMNWKLQKLDQN